MRVLVTGGAGFVGSNLAVVYENIPPGLIKTGTSTATITQTATAASNGNTACLTQNINLSRSGKGTSSGCTKSFWIHPTIRSTFVTTPKAVGDLPRAPCARRSGWPPLNAPACRPA